MTYVSASNATPGSIARNPDEFRDMLEAFAKEQGDKAGIETGSHPLILHDEAVDLDNALVHAVDEIEADMVIMASHKPGLVDHFWSSNGGAVARRSNASVFIVRED